MTETLEPMPVSPAAPARIDETRRDHRGSPIPTFAMIVSRFNELRRRRGLMTALVLVTVGIPTVFLVIRLILHAVAPNSYGPAGGYNVYTALVSGILYTFGFIVAATLGCTAGSIDLSEGMFRHLVVTGRSRLALYLARIPAGLAIIVSLVAVGFTVVCAVCVFAAPKTLNYDGANLPAGLSQPAFEQWASGHATEVICDFSFRIDSSGPSAALASVVQNVPCTSGQSGRRFKITPPPGSQGPGATRGPTPAQISAAAVTIANYNFRDYSKQFLYPSDSFMIKSGLWIELEAVIGFVVGLGLGSLIGQRTVGVLLMVVLEVILTPILSRARLPHLANLQRAVVGLATAHLAPGGLPVVGGGGGGPGGGGGNPGLLPDSTTVAVIVIIAWLVGWSILGAWRMMTRDA